MLQGYSGIFLFVGNVPPQADVSKLRRRKDRFDVGALMKVVREEGITRNMKLRNEQQGTMPVHNKWKGI